MGRLRVEELGDHRLLLRLVNRWLVVHIHALVIVDGLHGVALVQVVVDDFSAIIVEFIIILILVVAARIIEVLLFLIDLVRLTRIVLHDILIGYIISSVGLRHVELHPIAVDLLGYADASHLERTIEFALGLLDDWRAAKVLHCHGRLVTTVGA